MSIEIAKPTWDPATPGGRINRFSQRLLDAAADAMREDQIVLPEILDGLLGMAAATAMMNGIDLGQMTEALARLWAGAESGRRSGGPVC